MGLEGRDRGQGKVIIIIIYLQPDIEFNTIAHCEKGTCKNFYFRTYSHIITENFKSYFKK
jgi:hypothetical protein